MEVLRRGNNSGKQRGNFFREISTSETTPIPASNSSLQSRSRFTLGKINKQISDTAITSTRSPSPVATRKRIDYAWSKRKTEPRHNLMSPKKSQPKVAVNAGRANAKVVTALALALPLRVDRSVTSQRYRVISELYSTEIGYLKGVDLLSVVFEETLSPVLSQKEKDAIFTDTNRIAFVSGEFLLSLIDRLRRYDDNTTTVGDVILALAGNLNAYCEYCAGHSTAEKMLNKVKDRRAVAEALQQCTIHKDVQPGLTMQAYLLTPVQRLARYPLLVRDLLKRTDESHPDYKLLTDALAELEKAAQNIDNFIQERASAMACDNLKKEINTLDSYLEDESRIMQHEGQVCFQSPHKVHTCILFNDIMLLINEREVELCIPLESVWAFDVGTRDPQTCNSNALEIMTPGRPYTLYVKDPNEKKLWLGKIRNATHTHLEKKGYLRPNPEQLESITGLSPQSQSSLDTSALNSMTRYCELHVPDANGRYDGVWCDACRHGEGTQYFADGSFFTGSWEEDQMEGEGCLRYATGDEFLGKFLLGKQCGEGSHRFWNNDMYLGHWSDSLPHGQGKIDFWRGDELKGEFAEGLVCGHGKMQCLDGSKYVGEFRNNMFHGLGELVNCLGETYTGEFSEGKQCGHGDMLYVDGSRYVGRFKCGHRHGDGEFTSVDGSTYTGQWEHDYQSGKGKQVLADGRVYTGMFEHGQWNGQGKLTWPNGNTYTGAFEDGFMHGKGQLDYVKPKGFYRGNFAHDKKHNVGHQIVKHDCVLITYSGRWRCDQRSGYGIWVVSEAQPELDLETCIVGDILKGTHIERYDGDWLHDSPHGDGDYSHANCELTHKGQFARGHRNGNGIETNSSGRLAGYWVDGLRHGKFVLTASTGHCHESHWKNGSMHGTYTVKKNDKVCYAENMKNGSKVSDERRARHPPQIINSKWTLL